MSGFRFRKRPVVVEAIRWDGLCMDAFNVWLDPPDGGSAGLPFYSYGGTLYVDTLEGRMRAEPGDWIIKGIAGEYYPCKPDIFAETYEAEQAADVAELPAVSAANGAPHV